MWHVCTGDSFLAGVQALQIGMAEDTLHVHDNPTFSHSTISPSKGKKNKKLKPLPMNYAWVNTMSDVAPARGGGGGVAADVQDYLGAVLTMAVEQNVQPAIRLADFLEMSKNGEGKSYSAEVSARRSGKSSRCRIQCKFSSLEVGLCMARRSVLDSIRYRFQ
jgi:hypothetical protein